ncbi:rhomboid family intramembrane serine protease [Sphingobacterium psychroaquaticum]|uniref:Membrane associated serine protease, rhomboid family n=1 Tax=Sphingobacterium psychroaquaticum TaxID=561061 RepID=A0A1X7KI25_9SPHI|nr:rhomboid family intramembrane serine protease [Sphingobacterium psychroaquaticum]SMG40218.1 Membrane associated serine protease, rhomboid family [Sphingobacterium psychroaquaticum]
MKQSSLKTFWQNTYKGASPIPVIITIQVLLFVLIHIFDLLREVGLTQTPYYDYSVSFLSLPLSFDKFLTQPWSLLTFPFLYTGIFQLLFDCLWLFWIGNTFLVFLNKRQMLYLYFSAIMVGAVTFLLLGGIPALQRSVQQSFHTSTFGIVALVAATTMLVPKMEVRLFLFGNVQLRYIAFFYIALSIIFYALVNKAGAIAVLVTAAWGALYLNQLQAGRDFSQLFQRKQKRSKLRVVHHNKQTNTARGNRHPSDMPNQVEIDEILDKISIGGYESLTSHEKEVLFKASKSES